MLAGTGKPGFADGPCDKAQFMAPISVCFGESEQQILVTDYANNRIRCLDVKTNTVSTVAGSATLGWGAHKDGNADDAQFTFPHCLLHWREKNWLFISDSDNCCIRCLDLTNSEQTNAW